MKIGESHNIAVWENWFAWHPVWAEGERVVFEVVERKDISVEDWWTPDFPKYQYKRIDKTPKNINFAI
jgi:hypothetical protein